MVNFKPAFPLLGVVAATAMVTLSMTARAEVGDLRDVPVPMPQQLDTIIKDRDAAIALGKAFFWDMQVGVNEGYACATCHHKAGGDSRVNFRSLHPGANGQIDINGDQLTTADFPFGPGIDDIVGSIGVAPHAFLGVDGLGNETCELLGGDPTANQVTGMHSPATVNAIFSEQQFWDGRAQPTFNGVDIHGTNHDANSYPTVYEISGDGQVVAVNVAINNASLASQAVGPALNAVEMSCAFRDWGDLAQKLLPRKPLALQQIAPNDSVLGDYVDSSGSFTDGVTYRDLIYAAFDERYVSGLPAADSGWTVEEANFSLYWGLALNVYQALLVSDDSPWDRYVRGDTDAVSAAAVRGHSVFEGDGECDRCHRGSETSNAALTNGGGGRAFANIGLRPVSESEGLRRGEHKSVGIRNVEINNPYMWNGGLLTLRQLVDFYNRGGDFRGGRNELDPLGLTDQQADDLVAFMLALTDDRVRCDAGVFDHPSLSLDFGEALPAVGQDGLAQCWGPALDDGSVENFHYQSSLASGNAQQQAVTTTPLVRSQAPVALDPAEPDAEAPVVEDEPAQQQQVAQIGAEDDVEKTRAERRAEREAARAERRAARAERRAARAEKKRKRRQSARDDDDDFADEDEDEDEDEDDEDDEDEDEDDD